MARTLADILIDDNSILDLAAAEPTGTELATRSNYANQAVWDAAATGQLREFKSEFLTPTSTLATIPLPINFREFQAWPNILTSTGNWQEYEPIDAEEKYQKASTDYFCYVLGNPSEGYNVVFNNIIADATLSVIYQRYPSGLLTLTDVCELPDPQYVVRKVESYVLYSRSDERFPVAEQRAQQSLANMMGRGMKDSSGQGADTKMKFKHPLANG